MQRITISIDDDLLAAIDRFSDRRGHASRSEALRDMVREAALREDIASEDDTPSIATLTYVYEHHTRDLARRLTEAQHAHHDLSVACLHVHVDHRDCLEVAVLRGGARTIRRFADTVVTQRGVRHGQLQVIPLGEAHDGHDHPHAHDHRHR